MKELFEDAWSWNRRQTLCRCLTFVWGAALLIGSLQPARPANIHFGVIHHVIHFLAFGFLAVLATIGFVRTGRLPVYPAAASIFYGLVIELLQHFEGHMPVEWLDVCDDAAGILFFTVIYYVLCCRQRDRDASLIPLSRLHSQPNR